MKILIVNKFFYPRGGDCVVAMSTRSLLQDKGHDVRVFAMAHPDNIDIPDAKDYAPEVGFAGGLKNKLAGAERIFGYGDIRKYFRRVLDDFKPEVVHIHNIHSYLSPVIAQMAAERGIRVVWTLHDYKLLCPSYSCRTPDGNICEQCITGGINVFRKKCMKGSSLQSLIADLEARFWNRHRLEKYTDKFIAPSNFMRNKMLEGGFHNHSLTVIHNFIDPQKADILAKSALNNRSDYFCYVGRLSEEKGVETLLKGACAAGIQLKVAGGGPLAEELKTGYASYPNIEFLGHLDAEGVVNLLAEAKASIIPSECYENNPLSVIESLCAGTPVIGANIGGIPELISDKDGILFTHGSAEELARVLSAFDKRHPFDNADISNRATEKFSREAHYQKLLKAYNP